MHGCKASVLLCRGKQLNSGKWYLGFAKLMNKNLHSLINSEKALFDTSSCYSCNVVLDCTQIP